MIELCDEKTELKLLFTNNLDWTEYFVHESDWTDSRIQLTDSVAFNRPMKSNTVITYLNFGLLVTLTYCMTSEDFEYNV